MNKELQKQEALERMKLLKIHSNAIREFEKDNLVNLSEHDGMLYWLNDKQKEMVTEFEKEHDAVVYHVIHNYTEFGEIYSLLYVSKYKEEWTEDKNDIKYGTALVYVKNVDDDWCSEFGSIGIRPQFGGLVRTDLRS